MKSLKLVRVTFQVLHAPPLYLLAFFLALFLPVPGQGQVVINEIMANNLTTLANGGLFPDWVELYNSSSSPVNIGGYRLSDTVTNAQKFIFPAGTFMAGNGHLVVWCDPANTVAPGFHTGFSLKASGETVVLFAPDGFTQLDFITFGPQIADLSIGRLPDGPTGVWALNQPTPYLANRAQSLGSITNLFINEWVATNSTGQDWLELYNASTNPVALGGLVFSTTLAPTMPTNTPLRNLSFIDAVGFLQFSCVGNKSASKGDDLDFKLSNNTGETITLYARAGTSDPTNVIDRITFPGNNTVPNYWAPDVSYGRLPDGGTNILKFTPSKTTPGASNFQSISNVVINEALSHTDPPLEDAIELYNPTAAPVDISYWWISNQPDDPKKFQVPPGTSIAAGGYKVFYEQKGVTTLPHLGFNTSQTGNSPDFTLNSAHGDQIYLFTADSAGNLTGYRRIAIFGSAEHGISFGRYLTSVGSDFTAMSHTTFGVDAPATVEQFRLGTGLTNTYPKMGPLVISEIMYHPPDLLVVTNGTNSYIDNGLDEYIEVYNMTISTVSLYDTNGFYFDPSVGIYANGVTNTWKLGGMVNFDFPTNTHLAPGQCLVLVNFDPITDATQLSAFRSKYGVATNVPIFGPYNGGKLKNSGGAVELYKPDPPQPPSHPDFKYVPYILVDRINFNDHAPWPIAADGTGKALQRLVPENYGNDPINWVAADPTPGRQSLQIGAPQQVPNSVTFSFNGLAGSSYSVQYKNAFNPGSWTKLTNFGPLPTSGVQQVTAALTTSNRFYRLVTPAQP